MCFCSGTDRNNIVQTSDPNVNYPTPWDKLEDGTGLFENAEVLWTSVGLNTVSPLDNAVAFASAGYYHCFASSTCAAESVESKTPMNQLLNNAPASFEGALLRFKEGTYHYICSRNNNFTNRSQKGVITVKQSSKK